MSNITEAPMERDELGFWTHPAWPEFDDERAIPKTWFADNGLDLVVIEFEYDALTDISDAYYETGDTEVCKDWMPSKPEGEGWFVFSIHDTEDGPICVWVRQLPATS